MKILENLVKINDNVNQKIDEKRDLCVNKLKEFKFLLKPLIVLLVIYLLAFYPIARANINYIDDVGRVHSGYIEWDFFSRYVSKYFAIFMHTGTYLADISPLPQIVAIIILSITGCTLISLFNDEKKISLINIISVIPIGLSPYYLGCISFKYDAPYMSLSILASVLPFIFFKSDKKAYRRFFIANLLGTLVMCMTYQASSGIVPIVTIFLAFKLWSNKEAKEALKLIGLSALSYILGLIIFRLFILIPVDDYVSTSILPLKELIPGFFKNLVTYYTVINSTLRKLWKVLICAVAVLFVLTKTIQSKQNKVLSFFVSILVIIVSAVLTFGVLPALSSTTFTPRNIYSIGVLIALLAVSITTNRKYRLNNLIVFLLCWCFFTFSFLYGNAYVEQKRYENFRIQTVIDDLNDMKMMATPETKIINICGNIGRAPSIDNYPEGYRNMIEFLITQVFGDDGYYGYAYFMDYFKMKNVEVIAGGYEKEVEFTYVKDTMYYQIWSNEKDYILLVLK